MSIIPLNYEKTLTYNITTILYVLVNMLYYFIHHSGICDSSKESIDFLVSKNGPGNALCLVVGGAREALDTVPGEQKRTKRIHKEGGRERVGG